VGSTGLNWLDVTFLIVIALSVLGGILRGFAREALGLAGVVAGYILALSFAPAWSIWLERWMVPPAAYATMFVLILVGTMLIADILGQIITKVLKSVLLSVPNRLAGGVFGLVRGALLAVMLFIGLLFFTDDPVRITSGSRLAPYAAYGARVVLRWLPEKHMHYLEDRLPERRV